MFSKQYGLEERTYQFAKQVRSFIKRIPKTIATIEDGKQVIRSSGSVAANYIESVEAISEKDKQYRIRICRKESKEGRLWLRLIDVGSQTELINERKILVQEAYELACIFGSMVYKNSKPKIQSSKSK